MSVSIVAEDAASQPDRMRRAQVVGERLFVLNAGHVRIAFLHFAEQALFGRENGSCSVDVDRTAFQDNACAQREWPDFVCMRSLCHVASDFLVMTPVGVLRPRVKPKLEGKRLRRDMAGVGARATLQKDTAGVAHPNAVRRPTVKADISGEGIASIKDSARLPGCRSVVDDQLDSLVSREITNYFGIDPGNRFELSGPVSFVMRPCKPSSGVRFPLRGHAVAGRGGTEILHTWIC